MTADPANLPDPRKSDVLDQVLNDAVEREQANTAESSWISLIKDTIERRKLI